METRESGGRAVGASRHYALLVCMLQSFRSAGRENMGSVVSPSGLVGYVSPGNGHGGCGSALFGCPPSRRRRRRRVDPVAVLLSVLTFSPGRRTMRHSAVVTLMIRDVCIHCSSVDVRM